MYPHCLYKLLDGQRNTTSNSMFQVFEGSMRLSCLFIFIHMDKHLDQGILKNPFHCFLDFTFNFHRREVQYYDPLQ